MTVNDAAAVALGCAAVVGDLRHRTIPNWLSGAGVAAGLICGVWSGGARGGCMAVAGAAVGFAAFLLWHWLGGLGGGDVKLMAAFGALLGPSDIATAAVLAAIAGALLALAATLWKPRMATIPYAPAIVAGVWLVLLGRR
jgi:prepilin peptidase CpaA